MFLRKERGGVGGIRLHAQNVDFFPYKITLSVFKSQTMIKFSFNVKCHAEL